LWNWQDGVCRKSIDLRAAQSLNDFT
jgi:hypothetical protein